jgi:hypothetical protein
MRPPRRSVWSALAYVEGISIIVSTAPLRISGRRPAPVQERPSPDHRRIEIESAKVDYPALALLIEETRVAGQSLTATH